MTAVKGALTGGQLYKSKKITLFGNPPSHQQSCRRESEYSSRKYEAKVLFAFTKYLCLCVAVGCLVVGWPVVCGSMGLSLARETPLT